ncbi:hypothetical protein MMC13_004320 [Lambiella insularis]|nr:hypothetical protein [Lambiella insularis]
MNLRTLCIVLLELLPQSFAQAEGTASKVTSYTNVTAAASTQKCSPLCYVSADAGIFAWVSSISIQTVATLFVTINNVNGTQQTITSFQGNTTVQMNEPTFLEEATSWLVNDTTLEVNPGQTATYPTPYIFAFGLQVALEYPTTIGSVVSCINTFFEATPTSVWQSIIPLPTNTPFTDLAAMSLYDGGYTTVLPPMERSELGLPDLCSLVTYSTEEVPTANQPVLALTVTSIISNAATQHIATTPYNSVTSTSTSTSTTTFASPSSAISSMPSQTSNPQTSAKTQATAPESSSSSSVNQVPPASITLSFTNKPTPSKLSSLILPPTTPALTTELSNSEVPYTSSLPSLSVALTPSGSGYLSSSETLAAGGSSVTGGGSSVPHFTVAMTSVIGISTLHLGVDTTASPAIVIASSTITNNSASNYIYGSQTLIPGASAITVSDTPISISPEATMPVVGASTIELNTQAPGLSVITVDSSTMLANKASNYIYGSQILVPGGPTITVSLTPIYLALTATVLVIGTLPITLVSNAATLPILTIAGSILTADPASEYTYGSQTLLPGGPAITVSSTPIFLASAATVLVIGTKTIPLTPSAATLPLLTIASSTLTANSASDFVYGTQTLAPGGPAITVAGTPLSLAPAATQVVLGSSETVGLGGVIVSLLGGQPGVLTATGVTATTRVIATGRAGGRARGEVPVGWMLGVLAGIGGGVWLV